MTITVNRGTELLTVSELASYLSVSHHTIYGWQRKPGTGPHAFRVGAQLRFRRSIVDTWLEAGEGVARG
ncbi:DNA-binding protein [Cryobacterium sp. Sr8]|uniref:helix-turn-helix transcriptional regulator n=1 Tax=Cryobacterium sp. Sr8 TaxID=1259203 RepID=UPI00106BB740|nr:helix-turn-helix domain-containing protein [Cryobacterium sp. Sr8]TFD74618.1 DNA-binding protein [Cryobacterium sp. Sr8]